MLRDLRRGRGVLRKWRGEKGLGGGRAAGKRSLSVLSVLRVLSGRRRGGRSCSEVEFVGVGWGAAAEIEGTLITKCEGGVQVRRFCMGTGTGGSHINGTRDLAREGGLLCDMLVPDHLAATENSKAKMIRLQSMPLSHNI